MMGRSEERGSRRRGDENERESDRRKRKIKRERKRKRMMSPTDSDDSISSSSDGHRKRKEMKKERKENKNRRSKKANDKSKRRHRDDEDTASDDQEIHVKERGHKHKHKRKMTEDQRGQKQGLMGGVDKVKVLSEEDYFLKNNEFSTWLKEERGIFFSNLSSENAHMLFIEFLSAWNSEELHSKYYEGMSSACRTDHNWGLKGIKKTLYEDPIEGEIAKKIDKLEKKKFQKMQEVVLDELLPKATGHERTLEKRNIMREQMRAGDDSPEQIKERDLLGGSDDFHARLEKERMRRQKKQMERSAAFEEKLQASRQKEAAAMSQLQAIINDAGGKITIPKRN